MERLSATRFSVKPQTSAIGKSLPVGQAEIRPAMVAGAHYLAFHVKVAGEKEELLNSSVVMAWNVSAGFHADQ